jgi:hypothetical protein
MNLRKIYKSLINCKLWRLGSKSAPLQQPPVLPLVVPEHLPQAAAPVPPAVKSALPSSPTKVVDYLGASRRHLKDGTYLNSDNRNANAGQLFGFSIECGLKALVVASGAKTTPAGDLVSRDPYRTHLPNLSQLFLATTALPDGRQMNSFQAQMPGLAALGNWSIDHRYWSESAMPLGSIANWSIAAKEVGKMLDNAIQTGIVI